MRQYQEVKEQYPNCLLFFRLGDFYELFAEDLIDVRALVREIRVELRREKERIPRITLDERALDGAFAVVGAVHPRGVEIGETVIFEFVDHAAELFKIYRRAVVFVNAGKSHQSETEFFHTGPSLLIYCSNQLYNSFFNQSIRSRKIAPRLTTNSARGKI